VWHALAPSPLTNAVVSASPNAGGYVGSIVVTTFAAVDTATSGGSASANGATGAPTASLTTTKTGSIVRGVGDDWPRAVARTVPSDQTPGRRIPRGPRRHVLVQRGTALTGAVGIAVTLNDTGPTDDLWDLVFETSTGAPALGESI
jgi:hypothetical protein